MARREVETQKALANKASDEAAQVKKTAESAIGESQQKEHDKAEALASELRVARRDIEVSAGAGKQGGRRGRAGEAGRREHDRVATVAAEGARRAEALASDFARARRDIETQLALSSKASDETAQLKQTAESAMSSQSQKEHDKAEALASELRRRGVTSRLSWRCQARRATRPRS